jgi:hypothetical protein
MITTILINKRINYYFYNSYQCEIYSELFRSRVFRVNNFEHKFFNSELASHFFIFFLLKPYNLNQSIQILKNINH